MDDLTFRKIVYSDPYTKDPEVIKAANVDPKKKSFWKEVKLMEAELEAAMNIPVPENLAEKLILRQSLKTHQKEKKQRPWYLSLAASVALVALISISILKSGDHQLQDDVIAHLSNIEYEIMKGEGNVNIDDVNTKLASFNGRVANELGEIVSANYCYLDKIKSLHLIIRGENGLTSLFVIPETVSESIGESFSEASYKGASFLIESVKVIIVGENENDIDSLKAKAKTSLSFSV